MQRAMVSFEVQAWVYNDNGISRQLGGDGEFIFEGGSLLRSGIGWIPGFTPLRGPPSPACQPTVLNDYRPCAIGDPS